MRSRKLIELAIVTFITMSSTTYCQKIARIEDLGSRVEKLWEVNISIPPSNNDASGLVYSVLKDGIAVLSPDGQTIYCYDFNGQLRWQVPGIQINSSIGSLHSSLDGEYLYLFYPISEDVFTSTVYDNSGQLLWRANFESPFFVSPSGKYLISMYDALDQSMPLMVLDLATGNLLWKVETVPPHFYWQAAAGRSDKIVYYNNGSVRLFKLENGSSLWEKSVEFDPRADAGKVYISGMGNVIAYDCLLSTSDAKRLRPDPSVSTYLFGEDGNLLWNRTRPVIRGKSEGGRIVAISDGGEYVAMTAARGIALFDLANKKELWSVFERGLHSPTTFTEDLLAFYPRISPVSTKLITLKEDGSIDNNFTLNQFIDFRYDKRGNVTMDDSPILLQRADGLFVLSKFRLKFETSK